MICDEPGISATWLWLSGWVNVRYDVVMDESFSTQLMGNLMKLSKPYALCAVDGPQYPDIPHSGETADDAISRLLREGKRNPDHQPLRFMWIATVSGTAHRLKTGYTHQLSEALHALSELSELGDTPITVLDLVAAKRHTLTKRTVIELKDYIPVDLIVQDAEGKDVFLLPIPDEGLSEDLLAQLIHLGAESPENSVLWLRVGDVWLHPLDAHVALDSERALGTAQMLMYVASYARTAVANRHRMPPWHIDHLGMDTIMGNGAAAALMQRVLLKTIDDELDQQAAEQLLEAELTWLSEHYEVSADTISKITGRLYDNGWAQLQRGEVVENTSS